MNFRTCCTVTVSRIPFSASRFKHVTSLLEEKASLYLNPQAVKNFTVVGVGKRNMQELNMKSEADRRGTYEIFQVPFMEKNHVSCWILLQKLG